MLWKSIKLIIKIQNAQVWVEQLEFCFCCLYYTNETEEWVWLEHYYWQFYHYTIAILTVSLLYRLKCAEWSSLARKHKVKTNPAPVGAKKDNDACQRQHYYTDSSTTMIAILSVSLLDRLMCAQRSSLARKHKVKTNPVSVGARNSQRHTPTITLILTVLQLQ